MDHLELQEDIEVIERKPSVARGRPASDVQKANLAKGRAAKAAKKAATETPPAPPATPEPTPPEPPPFVDKPISERSIEERKQIRDINKRHDALMEEYKNVGVDKPTPPFVEPPVKMKKSKPKKKTIVLEESSEEEAPNIVRKPRKPKPVMYYEPEPEPEQRMRRA